MNQPQAAVADFVPNRRKPFVLVHVETATGRVAFGNYACSMVDHDFLSLGHRGPLPLATRRALVRAAACVLTDRPQLRILAQEQGKELLPIHGIP